MSWRAMSEDGHEFMRRPDGKLESRLVSYTFTCHRHGIHRPEALGKCFICARCGRDKPIFGSYAVLIFCSRDPGRIRSAVKSALKMPIPSTNPGEWRLEVNLDEEMEREIASHEQDEP